jgi:hypothetical protein
MRWIENKTPRVLISFKILNKNKEKAHVENFHLQPRKLPEPSGEFISE